MKNIRDFLDVEWGKLDTIQSASEREESEGEEDTGLYLYFSSSSGNILTLNIKELENRMFEFNFIEVEENGKVIGHKVVEVKSGEMKVMQTLIQYAMPALVGWHALSDTSVVGAFPHHY